MLDLKLNIDKISISKAQKIVQVTTNFEKELKNKKHSDMGLVSKKKKNIY